MTDKISKVRRSENMRQIRSKNMRPELQVRSIVHGMGYRYGLHAKDLPGKPDMVFRSRHKVIFVHGCFWHQHAAQRCPIKRTPKSNRRYWTQKLANNQRRDARNQRKLRADGWGCLTIWECQLQNPDSVRRRVRRFLDE